MSRYDDLFEETAATDSVFADKAVLDPLAPPDELVGRLDQERALASILQGVHEGYLPTTVAIYGPPGTGKTTLTRRLCEEFADRTDDFAAEYVNLKECRTIFSAANEILFSLSGEKRGAYAGLDGVFEGIWTALEDYPDWTVHILDEIDRVRRGTNDSLYKLLQTNGKFEQDIQILGLMRCVTAPENEHPGALHRLVERLNEMFSLGASS